MNRVKKAHLYILRKYNINRTHQATTGAVFLYKKRMPFGHPLKTTL